LKRALKVISPFYLCSATIGFIIAVLFPSLSSAFVSFASRGTIAGAWITPFLNPKNPLMIGLSIFLINFVLGTFVRFVLLPILLYHISFIFAVSMGFIAGFVIGSPTSLAYLSDISSFGTVLYILTIIFENLGYITSCAIGYKVSKESQEGLTTKELLKPLIVPTHLKDASRRQTIKKSLRASVPWMLLSMIFIILGTISETLLIIYFR